MRNGLVRGLINHRALARSIQEAAGSEASFDAILGAIRRYPLDRLPAKRQVIGSLVLRLSLKNKIAVLSLRNEREVQRAIAKFSEQVNYANGETFRVVSSMDAVSVTLDSKDADQLESKVSKTVVLRRLESLAELTVAMDAEIEKVPGVISTIASELATNDVNVRQLASVGPGRVLVLVDEDDALDAYRALEGLSRVTKS